VTPFREPPRPRASVLFVFGLGFLILASPARAVWTHAALPWWSPFAAWGAVLLLGGLAAGWWARGGRD
jgi:hypothetical protein